MHVNCQDMLEVRAFQDPPSAPYHPPCRFPPHRDSLPRYPLHPIPQSPLQTCHWFASCQQLPSQFSKWTCNCHAPGTWPCPPRESSAAARPPAPHPTHQASFDAAISLKSAKRFVVMAAIVPPSHLSRPSRSLAPSRARDNKCALVLKTAQPADAVECLPTKRMESSCHPRGLLGGHNPVLLC